MRPTLVPVRRWALLAPSRQLWGMGSRIPRARAAVSAGHVPAADRSTVGGRQDVRVHRQSALASAAGRIRGMAVHCSVKEAVEESGYRIPPPEIASFVERPQVPGIRFVS